MNKWIKPSEALPELHKPVIIARIYDPTAPRNRWAAGSPDPNDPPHIVVEQAHMELLGWWKVFGTRIKTKSVVAWMPMPEPPEE